MSFPKILFLILLSVLAATTVGTANIGDAGSVPQRLRVRVENQRLRTGEATKVFVEFLDRNYGQVVNDATRTIVLGQASSGSRMQPGSGYFDQQKIVVKPGEWSGTASFKSSGPGKLFITAQSEGLEPGQALVFIYSGASASDASASEKSLLSRFVSLFETTAHAQNDDLGFEILPKERSATAGGRHRATFTLSFVKPPAPGTTIRITTSFSEGAIYHKDQRVGGPVAEFKLEENEEFCEISVDSVQDGDFFIKASVRPDGPEDKATVEFTPPTPTQILFDAEPTTIGSDPTTTPLTVRVADEGGFPIKPDRERTINFSCATTGDQVNFEPKSVVLAPNQTSAQVLFRLERLPLGNELKLLATTDSGLHAGRKSLVIKSKIEKLLIAGPEEVNSGGNEGEYTVYLGDMAEKNHFAADWDRQIDLHVNGGTLSTRQLVIRRGQTSAVFNYTSPSRTGTYVLTASSGGITNYTQKIAVTHKGYWLAMFALFGGLVGGIGRQLHKHKKFRRILPRWNGKYWDLGFLRRLGTSLIGGLFFYWALKFGLSQAFGGPMLPGNIDLGTQTAAIFFGGIGGYSGTYVLEKLNRFLIPREKPPQVNQVAT